MVSLLLYRNSKEMLEIMYDILKLLDISLPPPSINDILNRSITPFTSFLY